MKPSRQIKRPWLVALSATALAATGLSLATVNTAQAASGCQVSYTIGSQWSGGFGATVAVTNLGDPITGWTLRWSFGAGQTVTQAWNATVTQSGTAVTAVNAGYNGALATNGSASNESTEYGNSSRFNSKWTSFCPVGGTNLCSHLAPIYCFEQ